MNEVLKIEHLTKHYGKNRGVIDLNLSIKKGEIFGFLGPNGAGKSTTIRSILGFINYQEGNVSLLGMDAKKDHIEILRQIGYMPSEAMFYNEEKVKRIIEMAAGVRGLECREEAAMLCERLKIDTDKKICELSLGNRKKVSIVCAMQHKPKLFIFDEPTSGLDPLMQEQFFELIKEYVHQGATCFLSTHVLSEVKRYCDRAAILKDGKLLCVDTVEALTKTNVKHIRVIKDGKENEFTYKGEIKNLIKKLAEENISDLLIEEPSLDDIFLQYYENERGDQNEHII